MTKKVLALCGVAVGGAIITTLIDHAIGVQIEGFWPRVIHTVTYLMWGQALASTSILR